MAFTVGETPNLISRRLDSGVYYLTLLKPTRAAVDEWTARVEEIWTLHNETRQPIAVLVDNEQAFNLPISYAFQQGLPLARWFRNLPKGRTALVSDDAVMTSVVNSFLQLMPIRVEVRFFRTSEHAHALAWLEELLVS